jgi:NADPH:quinone reductase-like Zn-dependent oxidoreductase
MITEEFEALAALYEAGHIHLHVDRSFAFSEAAAAHHYLHDRRAKGKVLLVPDGDAPHQGT